MLPDGYQHPHCVSGNDKWGIEGAESIAQLLKAAPVLDKLDISCAFPCMSCAHAQTGVQSLHHLLLLRLPRHASFVPALPSCD